MKNVTPVFLFLILLMLLAILLEICDCKMAIREQIRIEEIRYDEQRMLKKIHDDAKEFKRSIGIKVD